MNIKKVGAKLLALDKLGASDNNRLTEWEINFIGNLMDTFIRDKKTISVKQVIKIQSIYYTAEDEGNLMHYWEEYENDPRIVHLPEGD